MMAAPEIVCLGFGSWSSVAKLPTLGFGIGSDVVPDTPGLEFTLSPNRLHFAMPENRLHYTLPANRLHYTMPEED